MTQDRYHSYKRVTAALAAPWASRLDSFEREVLRQIAEDLLLSRTHQLDEAEDARQNAAVALSLLVGSQRMTDEEADLLWLEIAGCGPAPDAEPALTAA